MRAKEKQSTLFQKLKSKIMTEFEFIEALSEGNLAKNDIIKYAEGVCNKIDLLENIFAYIVSLNTINDEIIHCVNDYSFNEVVDNASEIKVKHGNQYLEKQERLYRAINDIEDYFSVKLFDNNDKENMNHSNELLNLNDKEHDVHEHYNKNDEQKAKKQFENLLKEGFFMPETRLDDWLYIYGVVGKEPNKKPLEWKKTQIELAYLVRSIWQNTDKRQWAICEKVFTINGKVPNIKVMKSTLSHIENGYRDKPKSFEKLERLLKN